MNWSYIITPLMGAIIGYITNWVAVKMLFRPRREIRVFGKKLPFTPGVIPRGQARLARAVGNVIETQLLTPEYLKEKLLSEEARKSFSEKFAEWKNRDAGSGESLREIALKSVSEEDLEAYIRYGEDEVTEFLYQKIIGMKPGKVIVEKVMAEVEAKLSQSFFGKMFGGSVLESLAEQIEERINEYFAENSRVYIETEVLKASGNLQSKKTTEIIAWLDEKNMLNEEQIWSIYVKIVEEKLPAVLSALKLSSIVEERINAMKVEEVEELVLSIMNKELGAIVNLGFFIGLILGIVNVLIVAL